ncbi:MAG: nucleoside-diphosphate kinase [Muribaculaceae bacterium]|nr:nucleoside-diphosphate kinase [Muribaculaceae bacterium]MDE6532636.1 nucleoside-diphosphate kinase [Muribaculaceae bacterium]
MEQTLVILKPSCVLRGLIGEVIGRIEKRGIIITAMKMMQLDEKILREHYAHLVDKPFFPDLCASMMATPVICMVLKGIDIVSVFRTMVGATNGRKAAPGTLRGDLCMSGQANIVHASDSPENAIIEINRFFKPEELTDYVPSDLSFLYANDELNP